MREGTIATLGLCGVEAVSLLWIGVPLASATIAALIYRLSDVGFSCGRESTGSTFT